MKYLTVLRHAKSSWNQPGTPDHDRPLNERGLRAAPAIARFLHSTYFGGDGAAPLLPVPSLILTSTALRAWSTAEVVQKELGLETLRNEKSLYLAPPQQIITVLRDLADDCEHAVLVAHNPGLHEFCDRILARAAVPRMPTCTAVIMGLPHEHWGLADWGVAQLIGYVTPRTLERRFPEKFPGITRGVEEVD